MVRIDMIHKARKSPFETGWSSILKIDAILFLYYWLVSWKGSLINLGMIDMLHETSGSPSPTQIGWSSIIEIDAILLLLACVTEWKRDKPGHASHGSTCHPLLLDAILLLLACVTERKLDKAGHESHGSTCHLVWLFCSVYEKLPDMGSKRSMLFPNFGSMISMAEHPPVKNEEWDVESQREGEGEGYTSDVTGLDSDDILQTPLISRQTTSLEKDITGRTRGTFLSMRRSSSLMQRTEAAGSTGAGSGWHS